MASLTLCLCVYLCMVMAIAQDLYEGDICKSVKGVRWTCKKIKQCKKAIQVLQSGGRPQVCSFSKDEPIVCCEPDNGSENPPNTTKPITTNTSTRKPPPQTTPTLKPSGSISRQMCEKYAEHVFVSVEIGYHDDKQKIDTCNQLVSLIVGGKDARPREFPHMTQIGYGEEKKIQWKCGGSLISERYILSAAHCTEVYGSPARWALLGEYNTNTRHDEDSGDAMPVLHEISQRINHPGYKAPLSANDIALYKLATDANFNEFVRPICLQTETFINRSYAVATGWGHTEYGGRGSYTLQKVNLTLTAQEECRNFYKPDADTLPKGIQDSMLCAGDTFSKKDSCQGDSGGPLHVPHPQLYCTYSQVGITSFGRSCGSQPGVYTRVSTFIPWIEGIVWAAPGVNNEDEIIFG